MSDNYFYKSVLENASVGYCYHKIIYNKNGTLKDYQFIEMNKAYESMLGIQAKNWIGKTTSELFEFLEKDSTEWVELHSKLVNKQEKTEFEKKFNHLGKNYRVKTYQPKKDSIIVSLTDVSREVEEIKSKKLLFDSIPIQVWYLKDSNTYLSANKAHADFIGFKSEELVLKDIKEILSTGVVEICVTGNERVFKENKKVITEEWSINHQGEKRLLKITKNPKFNDDGEIDFVVCSAEDITEDYINRKQNEMQERILYSSVDFTQELLTNNNLEEALANGIEMLGNATKVDRVYYWENHYDEDSGKWLTSQKNEWSSDKATRELENENLQDIPFEEVGYFIKTLSEKLPFSNHVKDLNDDDGTKKLLESQGILSILVIPVFIKDDFRGFIGFDSCDVEKEWTQVEISLLSSFVLLYVKAYEKNMLEKRILQSKDNFDNFFNTIQDLLFVIDYDGNMIEVNDNVLEKLNYSREELLGESVLKLYPKDRKEDVKKNLENAIAGKDEFINIPAITKEGHMLSIETRVSRGIWNRGPVIFAALKDTSELSLSEDKFSKAFNNSVVSMFISKFKDGEFVEVNDTFLNYLGYTEEEVVGKTTLELEMTVDYKTRQIFKEMIETDNKITDLQMEFITKDQKIRTGLTNIVPLMIGNEKHLLSSIIDISDRIAYEKKILEISNRDSLTNIYNRRFIYERVDEMIEKHKRTEELFSIVIIDIDNFKEINDQYGHQVGDSVLIDFVKIVKNNLRPYDILGRYGGEEFIAIINDADIEESNQVLKRVLDAVRNMTFTCGENQIELTFSGGIASCGEFSKDEISRDKLIEISDKRMYTAKNTGKNQIVYKENY